MHNCSPKFYQDNHPGAPGLEYGGADPTSDAEVVEQCMEWEMQNAAVSGKCTLCRAWESQWVVKCTALHLGKLLPSLCPLAMHAMLSTTSRKTVTVLLEASTSLLHPKHWCPAAGSTCLVRCSSEWVQCSHFILTLLISRERKKRRPSSWDSWDSCCCRWPPLAQVRQSPHFMDGKLKVWLLKALRW